MMSISFPGESPEYRAARDRLLKQEVELRRATEAVAEARRALPPGGVVPEDYVFQREGPDGAPAEVRLSELFGADRDTPATPTTTGPARRPAGRRCCRSSRHRARRAAPCSTSSTVPPSTPASASTWSWWPGRRWPA